MREKRAVTIGDLLKASEGRHPKKIIKVNGIEDHTEEYSEPHYHVNVPYMTVGELRKWVNENPDHDFWQPITFENTGCFYVAAHLDEDLVISATELHVEWDFACE